MLALVESGLTRQVAYVMVQRNAMPVWEEGRDFKEMLLGDAEVLDTLGEEGILSCFSMKPHTEHVDAIFRRVFGD